MRSNNEWAYTPEEYAMPSIVTSEIGDEAWRRAALAKLGKSILNYRYTQSMVDQCFEVRHAFRVSVEEARAAQDEIDRELEVRRQS